MAKQNKQPKSTTIEQPVSAQKQTNPWAIAIVIAIFGFLLYSNTLKHEWALDDYSVIKKNEVTQRGIAGIPTLLTTEYRYGYWNSPGSLYRPLSLVMFALQWQVSEDNPAVGHFLNCFLFSISLLLIFFFIRKLLNNNDLVVPSLVTLLFAAHPVHSEVVANIKSLDEIMMLLFSLIAMHQLLKYQENKNIVTLVLGVFSYMLAMFSKESAITFLAIFPLTLIYFRQKNIAEAIKSTAVFAIPVVLFLFVRWRVLSGQSSTEDISALDNAIVALNGFNRIGGAFAMLGVYLQTLFLPMNLVSEYGWNASKITGWSDWRAIAALVAHVAMLVYVIKDWKNKGMISFGILFYFCAISVSSNVLLTIGTNYGERLVYAASLGFFIAFVSVLKHFFAKENNVNDLKSIDYNIVFLIIGIFSLFYSFKTFTRNKDWKDSFTLYQKDVLTEPDCSKLNYHYALEQNLNGQKAKSQPEKQQCFDDAITHFEKSIALFPKYPQAIGELGLAYYYKGNLEKATENYKKSLEYATDSKVLSNLGTVYFQQNKLAEAEDVYTKAIALDTRFVDARRNLGVIYAITKRFPQAIEQFKEAIKYAPKSAILYFYVGSAFRDSGDATSAQPFLEKAYAMDPSLKK
jgi:tetratricopeptide (TPR) repeat protein